MSEELCKRCKCCSAVPESAPCWQCGGFEPDMDDEWDHGWCSVCEGEGKVYFLSCLGGCDDNGIHAQRPNALPKEAQNG